MDHPASPDPNASGVPKARAVRLTGLSAVVIALPYITNVMPVEEEVGKWGLLSLGLGVLLLVLAQVQTSRAAGWLAGAALVAVVLLQVLPIALWLVLGVTTDSPWIQRGVKTRLAFAAAHGTVLLIGLWATFAVVRRRGGVT